MIKIYSLFTVLSLLVLISSSKAQRSLVQVNQYSGTSSVIIPIYTIANGAISSEVNLVNNGVGVKVRDVEAIGGIGWQLTGGGKISREVRGLPDDVIKDKAGNSRLGWLYNSNGWKLEYINFINDGNTATCADETTDVNVLNSNFGDLSDTEPDVFTVDAPGLSFKFVFDKDHEIKLVSYQDVKISYQTNPATGEIDRFTLVNDQGTSYSFSNTNLIKSTRQSLTTISSGSAQHSVSESNIAYYKTQYLQYKNGISSSNEWYLNSITDASKNEMVFSYTEGLAQESITPIELYLGTTNKTIQYWMNNKSTPQLLNKISAAGLNVGFTYLDINMNSQSLLNSITINENLVYTLTYDVVRSMAGNTNRYFLRRVTNNQCNSPSFYSFKYVGESYVGSTYKTILADSSSKNIDYWGYTSNYASINSLRPSVVINPSGSSLRRYQIVPDNLARADYTVSMPAANRITDPSTVTAGALSEITYFDNGSTTLVYEPHSYYDPGASANVEGGGIRIKQIIEYDGIDLSRNIVTNFTYTNPLTGLSSGKPISLPVFAFTRPYVGSGSSIDLWNSSTVLSDTDLSTDDHSIVYNYVRSSKTGSGSTLSEFYAPATYYDESSSPSCNDCGTVDWFPTVNYVARLGCSGAGYMSSGIRTYPFSPNPNYDFERGLIKHVKEFNEAGGVVAESEYSYQRLGNPIVITGLKCDDLGTFKAYAKYNLYTSSGELVKQVKNKVKDLPPANSVKETAITYSYDSPYHKLPTSTESLKSDGTLVRVFNKYVKDYQIPATGDSYATGLYNLQLKNQNLPVEEYTQLQKTGSATTTISGSLMKYKDFDLGTYNLTLPAQKLKFISQNGVSNYSASSVSSAGNLMFDGNYIPIENYLSYDIKGNLQTIDNAHKKVQTNLANYLNHSIVASISNAHVEEVGYFNANNEVKNGSFVLTSGDNAYAAPGRSPEANSAVYLRPGSVHSRVIRKNNQTKNYVFSIWIKSELSGAIVVKTTGTDNLPHSYPINFVNTDAKWKYFEIKVPVAGLSQDFNVSWESTLANLMSVTDVLFYPENAEVVTYDYKHSTRSKISETNTTGQAIYYTSDEFGRPVLVLDQDRQIVSKKSYNFIQNQPFVDPVFSMSSSTAEVNQEISFFSTGNFPYCQFEGIEYTWDFGNGSAPVVGSWYSNTSFKFHKAGTYTVTLTVSAPGYGTKSTTQTIIITTPPVIPSGPSVIPVNVSDPSSNITSIEFSQNGVLKFSFTADQFYSGIMVPAESFSIRVRCAGSLGSVKYDNNDLYFCKNYIPGNTYTFLANLTVPGATVNISTSNQGCQ